MKVTNIARKMAYDFYDRDHCQVVYGVHKPDKGHAGVCCDKPVEAGRRGRHAVFRGTALSGQVSEDGSLYPAQFHP